MPVKDVEMVPKTTRVDRAIQDVANRIGHLNGELEAADKKVIRIYNVGSQLLNSFLGRSQKTAALQTLMVGQQAIQTQLSVDSALTQAAIAAAAQNPIQAAILGGLAFQQEVNLAQTIVARQQAEMFSQRMDSINIMRESYR